MNKVIIASCMLKVNGDEKGKELKLEMKREFQKAKEGENDLEKINCDLIKKNEELKEQTSKMEKNACSKEKEIGKAKEHIKKMNKCVFQMLKQKKNQIKLKMHF